MALMRNDMMFVLVAAVFYGSKYVSASAGPSMFSSIQVGLSMEKDVSDSIILNEVKDLIPDVLQDSNINDIFGDSFSSSGMVILVSELGDKTFFIAALLSMKHSQQFVFLGCFGALAAMTVLSATMGTFFVSWLPKEYTHWASIVLFFYFGLKLSYEAVQMFMDGKGEGPSEELDEVKESLDDGVSLDDVAVFIQAFTMCFLAEWGDRSQIATVALAAAKNPIGVALGGVAGHGCCTALAVIGGHVLASQISERAVMGAGGALFLAFGAHGYYVGVEA